MQKLCLENGEESWRREISRADQMPSASGRGSAPVIVSPPHNVVNCKGLFYKTAPEFWSRPDCKVRINCPSLQANRNLKV